MAAREMDRAPGEYFFKFQFFVHQLTLTKEFANVVKPAVAIRFLDFPTLIIPGHFTADHKLAFNKGKCTSFKMDSESLKASLQQKPFYVMFIDSNTEK